MDKRHGLTLLELLTVMAIIGTTIFCIPPMIKWMNQQGVRHAVEQLRADLQLARVMAIRKKQTCTVTFNKPGPNQYSNSLSRSISDLSGFRGDVHFMPIGPNNDPMSDRINFTRRGMTTPAADVYLADTDADHIYKIRVLVPGGISIFRWNGTSWQ